MLFIYKMRIERGYANGCCLRVYYHDNHLHVRVEPTSCVSFSNFTCKYSRNHSTAIVFIFRVAYLISPDDGSIINQDLCADQCLGSESWLCSLNGSCFSHYFIFIPLSDIETEKYTNENSFIKNLAASKYSMWAQRGK